MADENKPKSSLPSLDEASSIAKKFYQDVKKSVIEIVQDYKEKRKQSPEAPPKKDEEDKKP